MQIPPLDTLNLSLLLPGAILVLGNRLLGHAQAVPSRLKALFLRWFSVTLEIPGGQYPFDQVKKFLATQRPFFRQRNFSVVCSTDKAGNDVVTLPPAPGAFYFRWEGRLAVAYRSRKELDKAASVAFVENFTIRFHRGGPDTIRRFVLAAEREANASKGFTEMTFDASMLSSYAVDRPSRPLSTVFLPAGMAEDIREDAARFFADADRYRRLGIPHRRGYLFRGEPGTGKTSVIKGLAAEFNLKLRIINLSHDGMTDGDLIRIFSSLNRRTIPVLEDIDCLMARDGLGKVTMSGLLNAIDGVTSPEGYVLCMTTNHPERLDPALIRPGRIDRQWHVTYATPEQASRYFRNFYGGREGRADVAALEALVGARRVTMASLQDLLLDHPDDPAAAAAALEACR